MAFKCVILCTSVFIIQYTSIAGQCVRPAAKAPSSCVSITLPDSGGALAVTSVGPISPSGITVTTDLGLTGTLDVAGTLPYLSAVAFDGQFETNGTAPLQYGCGDCVAITQEVGNPSGSNAAVSSSYNAGSINNCRRS